MNEKIYSLKAFSGLCENPDGDTKLRFGQASVCRNFAVTRDGKLRHCIRNRNQTKRRNYPAEEISNDEVNGVEESSYTSGENFCRRAGNKMQAKRRNYPAEEILNDGFKCAEKSACTSGKNFRRCVGSGNQTKQRNYPVKELFNREFKVAKKSAWANNKVFSFRADCKRPEMFAKAPVHGIWNGLVKGTEKFICACVAKIRKLIIGQNCKLSCL